MGATGIPGVEGLPEPPPRDTIPLTLEPITEQPAADRPPLRPPAPRALPGRTPAATRPDRPLAEPPGPRGVPRRGAGVLGRFFGPLSPAPPREESRTPTRSPSWPERESDEDPDAAARRRIERQVRATLGDRVRSFEVRVNGRNVLIVAQPSRFWLRRSVRRSLETLPALQGYRARIELGE